MNLLKNCLIYLAGPMEYADDHKVWRDDITPILEGLGVKVLNPNKDHFINQATETDEDRQKLYTAREKGDWDFVHEYLKGVIRRDLRMVDLSTLIIAYIDPLIPTFGTVHELVLAVQQGKAVLVHTKDKKRFPLWLAGLINMNLVFESWEELVEYIKGINSGEIYADPKYWKILIHE